VPPHRRNVGFLFQDFALFPHLTVAENVTFGLARLGRDVARARTVEMLEKVQLLAHAGKYPHMLSGGEQQRVALARALAPGPALMLLDEPFSDLDTSLRGRVRDETLRILRDAGVTTVMVTHDPEEAMLAADRIVLMREGRIVQTGTPDALYLNPVDAFTAEFFGDINRLDGVVEGAWIRTCLGAIANRHYPDGSRVEVLIRPDALTLAPPGYDSNQAEAEARVCAVQYAGRSSLVRIGLGDGTDPRMHFHARQPGLFPSRVGERLRVRIDQAQAFVFEKPGHRAG
jgi:iron(III) transport system ATP-binding protein